MKMPILLGILFIILAAAAPNLFRRSSQVTLDYLKEMALIMPPVFILMGLIEVWVPKDKIQKWLGHGSGLKGGVISVLFGSLPTGPLYAAFPMTASLLKKGASVTNMVLFLGSWAALKIPQLIVEAKFLGLGFTGLRFILTLAALILIGLTMNRSFKSKPAESWLPEEGAVQKGMQRAQEKADVS